MDHCPEASHSLTDGVDCGSRSGAGGSDGIVTSRVRCGADEEEVSDSLAQGFKRAVWNKHERAANNTRVTEIWT